MRHGGGAREARRVVRSARGEATDFVAVVWREGRRPCLFGDRDDLRRGRIERTARGSDCETRGKADRLSRQEGNVSGWKERIETGSGVSCCVNFVAPPFEGFLPLRVSVFIVKYF